MSELVNRMRKTATCVFLACEESVAKDISTTLKAGADRIEFMKCCGNCEVFVLNNHHGSKAVCNNCCRTSVFKTGKKPTEDKWIFATEGRDKNG